MRLAGRVLVVCTGNVCRSPYLERLLTARLESPGIEVTSAGTAALTGRPMAPEAAALLEGAGGDPTGFTARQLTPELVAATDLVLAATRDHRARVAAMHPPALRYVFTVGDFADLVRDLPEGEVLHEAEPGRSAGPDDWFGEGSAYVDGHEPSWVARVASAAARRRGLTLPRPAAIVDLTDPYRRGDAEFVRMAAQVEQALPALIHGLRASKRSA